MFNLFNKSGLTRGQKQAIRNLSTCKKETDLWTKYFELQNELKGGVYKI